MITRKYRCLNCGHDFKTEVFEKGEAERKQVYTQPVHCPKCNRTDLREDK